MTSQLPFFLAHIWLIPMFPLITAAAMLFFGRRLKNDVINALCVGSVFISFIFSAGSFLQLLSLPEGERFFARMLFQWLPAIPYHMFDGRLANFVAGWEFQIDPLTAVMILVVTGVGFLIHVYSTGYMAHEGGYYRFFGYLNLFMFAMLILVLANNFLMMFVGWEGVGTCSYLLIGFYFHRKSASDAGKKAFIVNRVGDAGFLLGIFLCSAVLGTVRFSEIGPALQAGHFQNGDPWLTAIALLLFVGAAGKSAQIPLYVWLPDAMEGPTPVSALIHAATMVTAGVYMVTRTNAIYQLAPKAMGVVALVGAITALFAATIGVVQNDIKKVLAYSTVSQLGYMFLACGVGAFTAGIFHLMTHAFFKGLLFLAAGSVIHALSGEQDMRKMGALRKEIPWTFWTMTAATVAIAGIPFFSGFFSKDEILWKSLSSPYGSRAYWAIGVFTALLTSFYMFRLWLMTFFGEYRGSGSHGYEHAGHAHPTLASAKDVLAEIVVPAEFVSTVMSNMIERNGMVVSFEERGGMTILQASVPAANMARYEEWLREHTSARGTWSERAPGKEGKAEVLVRPMAMQHEQPGHIHESPRVMLVPMVILAILAVFGGYIGVPEALGGHNRFEHFLAHVFTTASGTLPS